MRRASAVAVIGGLLAGVLTLGVGTSRSWAAEPDTTQAAAQVLAAEVTPSAARPGETFTVTMTGCIGGELVAGLWVPFASDPVISTGPLPSAADPVVGTLTIPLGAAPTAAHVVVVCTLDAEVSVTLPVEILAASPSTTAAPAVEQAAAVRSAPAFTG